MGILVLVYYRKTGLVKAAPHVLFIVGGALTFIPLVAWAGGILAIIGGALNLASIKNFKTQEE